MRDISSDDPKLESTSLHVLDADMHNDNNQYDLMPPSSRKKKEAPKSQQTPRRHQESRGERAMRWLPKPGKLCARGGENSRAALVIVVVFVLLRSRIRPGGEEAIHRVAKARSQSPQQGLRRRDRSAPIQERRGGAAPWANAIRLTVAHMPGAIFHASATSVNGSVSSAAKNDLAGAGAAAETKTMASAPGQKTARARRAEPRLDASKQMLFLPFSAQTGYAATRT